MKKTFLFLFGFFLLLQTASAQDLIVTEKGDSINAKITKIKDGYIYFAFKYENEIRSTLLQTSQVKSYKQNFYTRAEVPPGKIKGMEGTYTKFRFGLFGGWSRRTAKLGSDVPADFVDYENKLKSGFHLGGDFTFFTNSYIGFGVIYSYFNASNKIDNVSARNTVTGVVRTGILSDDISIQFIGPTFCTRYSSGNNRRHFISTIAIGYAGYKDDAVVIDPLIIKGSTLGILFDLGGDFEIDNNLFLCIGISFMGASLSEYTIDDGHTVQSVKLAQNSYEGLSRLDISAGLRLHL